jgi:hypothetical protein
MFAERYILVTEENAGADVGRDAETDVAIEDDGMEEDDGGAVDGESRIGWNVGDGFADGDRDAGTGAGDRIVLTDDDSEDQHYDVKDWTASPSDV